jgi:hypothetical protein
MTKKVTKKSSAASDFAKSCRFPLSQKKLAFGSNTFWLLTLQTPSFLTQNQPRRVCIVALQQFRVCLVSLFFLLLLFETTY